MADLRATYRLQLSASFTLRDARHIVPYLDRLGISHLYCSPILQARSGSTHGYDVVDPTRLNPALGTEDDLAVLADALHARGMGILLDIVPNHMAATTENPAWNDMLTHGEGSRYARWFDVDWGRDPRRQLTLPVLGDGRARIIQRGELIVRVTESGQWVEYHEHRFPLDPATLPDDLQLARWDPQAAADAEARYRGDAGRAALEALLARQHYQLMHWRRAPHALNYRRFFDINDLVALRMEDRAVFDETHALVLRWVESGLIDALRVDHIDGLRDPVEYLRWLREETTARRGAPIPILVEKILSSGERLRPDWPVEGTTGYEVLNDIEDLFIDPAGLDQLEGQYRRLRRANQASFAETARTGKREVLAAALRTDVRRLSRALAPLLAAANRGLFAPREIDAGVREFIAALPVYRTYIDEDTPDPIDVAVIEQAVAAVGASAGDDASTTQVALFIADLLLGRVTDVDRAQRLGFGRLFQQTTGPATAKGVEDTALYRYVPLASRNEVGGAPDHPLADAVPRLHRGNAERASRWPRALVTVNTHDTKRSADVRARIDALSEMPREWARTFARWQRMNHAHRRLVKGRMTPISNTEWLFYQTLVGMWEPDGARGGTTLTERLQAYMLKAMREAKLRTSWVDQDAEYETTISEFVAAAMTPRDDVPFLADVERVVGLVEPIAYWTSLARLLVHLTVPGTPDIYQGDEFAFLALVDPDNRRPVDYAARSALLEEVMRDGRTPLDGQPSLSRAKIAMTATLLNHRREHAGLFASGSYEPVAISGARAQHAVAYARRNGGRMLVAVVPRLLGTIRRADGAFDWGDTALTLPANAPALHCLLTGARVESASSVRLDRLLAERPIGCWVGTA